MGPGTWVESIVDLEKYRGKRIRLRFLATSFKVGSFVTYEDLFGFNPDPGDDGWFIDDVEVTHTLTEPVQLSEDTKDPTLLPTCGANCNTVIPALAADPIAAAAPGYPIELDASGSIADRCVDGILQFRFWRDGNGDRVGGGGSDELLRGFTSDPVELIAARSVALEPVVVDVRCSTAPDCAGTASIEVPVSCPSSLGFDPLGGPLRADDGATLSWPLPVTAAPLARGRLAQVGTLTTDLRTDVAGASYDLSQDDVSGFARGDGYWYLLKGEGRFCNQTSWSSGGDAEVVLPGRDTLLDGAGRAAR